ncbi:MAG: hypothetical protein CBC73_01380 [Flavobacteriales bacterium TMED113]|nr:MAG: hypothetical protein CBC73_01380 [Flavobacteriales bacterium TMED113]|tara:strand:+ start:605 stop:1459 length:855 start_codon:yes stop_codon:yes gene_type:complete
MIVSMTGYNYSTQIIDGVQYSVQIKTLNSKTFDCNIKSPNDKFDQKIRLLAKKILKRGKIEFNLKSNVTTDFSRELLDTNKINLYVKQFQKISPSSSKKDLLQLALAMPGLHLKETQKLTKKSEKDVIMFLQKAMILVSDYRIKEGAKLEKELIKYLKNIINQINLIKKNEKHRIKPKREKIEKKLKMFNLKIDKSRLEQEMIFFLEKIDITEELVRLDYHCSFFLELIKKENQSGRKLNFLCQEILREVNTIGSKSSDFKLQKSVILIKEEIEKIKEQVQNVL